MEIYVLECTADAVVPWLEATFESVEQTLTAPAPTFEVKHEGATLAVQVAEGVEGGRYTSIYLPDALAPWDATTDCAYAARDALGTEVLCYLDDAGDDPWKMLRLPPDGGAEYVDRREINF